MRGAVGGLGITKLQMMVPPKIFKNLFSSLELYSSINSKFYSFGWLFPLCFNANDTRN